MLLDAIDHVQLAMPNGGEELASWFYEDVLGVPRVPMPPHVAVRGGCWFERGSLRIHVAVDDDFIPATTAHPTFTVVDLDRLESQLGSRGIAVRRVTDPVDVDVLHVDDPFGNLIELRPERPPVGEPAAAGRTVVDVARATHGDRFARQMAFVQELDRLKSVQRQSFVLDTERRENSAEHSWHVALLATVLAEHADEQVDVARSVLLLLVHDLVEIDAGDTGIYDADGGTSKSEREQTAADRLYGILPDDLGVELRAAWEEYEWGDTPEARFARVFDRLAPFLLNVGAEGMPWRRWGVTAVDVREVLRPIGAGSVALGEFVDALLDQVVTDGLLPGGGSGIILPGAGDAP